MYQQQLQELKMLEQKCLTESQIKTDSSLLKNFTVAIKIRPLTDQLPDQRLCIKINPQNNQTFTLSNPKLQRYSSKASKQYQFDRTYDEPCSNQEVFEGSVQRPLQLLRTNFNVSLLAYGATCSGKTYTIFGKEEVPGLALVSMNYVTETLLPGASFSLSYIQIYNQQVNDLLAEDEAELSKARPVYEQTNGKIVIQGCKKVKVSSFDSLVQLVERGNAYRKSASNTVNLLSSRSHAVITLYCSDQSKGIETKLTIIDLAGSEKVNRQGSTHNPSLYKEGSNINRSLLALGNCIQSLCNEKKPHVPYRNSKLTRILKDNLQGRSHNILIGCISPNVTQYEETLNTLSYASKAIKIQRQVPEEPIRNSKIQCNYCHQKIPIKITSKKDSCNTTVSEIMTQAQSRIKGPCRQKVTPSTVENSEGMQHWKTTLRDTINYKLNQFVGQFDRYSQTEENTKNENFIQKWKDDFTEEIERSLNIPAADDVATYRSVTPRTDLNKQENHKVKKDSYILQQPAESDEEIQQSQQSMESVQEIQQLWKSIKIEQKAHPMKARHLELTLRLPEQTDEQQTIGIQLPYEQRQNRNRTQSFSIFWGRNLAPSDEQPQKIKKDSENLSSKELILKKLKQTRRRQYLAKD